MWVMTFSDIDPIADAEQSRPASELVSEDKVGGFESLFVREQAARLRLAFLLVGSVPAAEEAVQDAFATVYQKWSRLDLPCAFLRTWVVNQCRSRNRRALWRCASGTCSQSQLSSTNGTSSLLTTRLQRCHSRRRRDGTGGARREGWSRRAAQCGRCTDQRLHRRLTIEDAVRPCTATRPAVLAVAAVSLVSCRADGISRSESRGSGGG